MNIEEARKVLWLKSNPRPLGELLSDGYLTKDRLEWAAQWAYNFKLKEAAKVLLESIKAPAPKTEIKPKPVSTKSTEIPTQIGITLEKAKATEYPLPPYKGLRMGELVQSRQITLKDLGYLIENAWDPKVKQAAIALSLVRLNQAIKEPTPSAGFVNVVSGGRSYSERMQLWLVLIEGLVYGFLIAFIIFVVILQIINFLMPHPNAKPISDLVSSQAGIIALIILLVILLIFSWLFEFIPNQITKRLDKLIEEARFGQEGEDRVVETIVQALDGNWSLFRNISLSGRYRGDMDLVLVGPPGVWALEVKNLRGKYRNIGDKWEYQKGKTWKTAKTNPSRQVHKDAIRFANFLKADHLNVFVNEAVVWANPENPPSLENQSTQVWTFEHLPDELGNIWQVEKLSKQEREKIVEKLSKLCERQKVDR